VPEDSPAGLLDSTPEVEGPEGSRPQPRRGGVATCHVIQHGGSAEVEFTRETVEGLLAGGGFFFARWSNCSESSTASG
jgi:hypothetical protein